MFTDSIRHLLGDRRREIAATRQRKQFEEMIERTDTALLELDANENTKNERELEAALDAIRAHVLARMIDDDTSTLPLDAVFADGRTVRDVCADEIAAVGDVPRCAEKVRDAENYTISDRERIEEAKRNYIEPLEKNLAVDVAEVEAAKKRAADAVARLNALKRKYNVD